MCVFERGLAFEAWVKWRMGSVEITDQEDCVHWAVKQVIAGTVAADAEHVSYFCARSV